MTSEGSVMEDVDCIKPINSEEEFQEFISQKGFVNSCFDLNKILQEFQKENTDVFQIRLIYAEDFSKQSKQFNIIAVPTIVFFKDGREVDKLEGFHPVKLRELVFKHHFDSVSVKETVPKAPLEDRLKELINTSRFTLFMKGNRNNPKCGFSRQICELLSSHNAEFWTFDILTDNEVREGLKKYSDWPTYPQLYLDGEFLGGLDVIREEMKNQEFVAKLPKITEKYNQSTSSSLKTPTPQSLTNTFLTDETSV